VIITADTDLGALLVQSGKAEPSVILVRELLSLPVASQGRLLADNVDQVRDILIKGAIVVFHSTTLGCVRSQSRDGFAAGA
jgi:predicted nuclease of predicted toxin-antitoxin system